MHMHILQWFTSLRFHVRIITFFLFHWGVLRLDHEEQPQHQVYLLRGLDIQPSTEYPAPWERR